MPEREAWRGGTGSSHSKELEADWGRNAARQISVQMTPFCGAFRDTLNSTGLQGVSRCFSTLLSVVVRRFSEQREQESRQLVRRAFTKSLPQYPFRRMDPAAYASSRCDPLWQRVSPGRYLCAVRHAGRPLYPLHSRSVSVIERAALPDSSRRAAIHFPQVCSGFQSIQCCYTYIISIRQGCRKEEAGHFCARVILR